MRNAALVIAGLLLLAGLGCATAAAQGPPAQAQGQPGDAGPPEDASSATDASSAPSDAGSAQPAERDAGDGGSDASAEAGSSATQGDGDPTSQEAASGTETPGGSEQAETPAQGEAEPTSTQDATPATRAQDTADETTETPADAQPAEAPEDAPTRSGEGASETASRSEDPGPSGDRTAQASPAPDPPATTAEAGNEEATQARDSETAIEEPNDEEPQEPAEEPADEPSEDAAERSSPQDRDRRSDRPEASQTEPTRKAGTGDPADRAPPTPDPPEPAEQTDESSEPTEPAGDEQPEDPDADWMEPVVDLSPTLDGAAGGSQAGIAPGGSAATTSSGDADGGIWAGWSLIAFAVGVSTLVVRPRERLVSEDPEPETATTEPDGAEQPAPPTTGVETPGPDGLLLLGQEALDRGELETAIGWFETAIALQPDLQSAHFCIGLCLDELGRLEEAADALGHACQLPHGPMTEYAHASVLARLGETQEAVAKLERVVDESPDLADRLREDGDLDVLADHPRFLALTGQL